MDALTRDYYDLKFYKRYHESEGTAFQDLFSLIMETVYPEDFQRVVP